MRREDVDLPPGEKSLGFYLCCNTDASGELLNVEHEDWSSYPVSVVLRVLPNADSNSILRRDDGGEGIWKAYGVCFTREDNDWGWSRFTCCQVRRIYTVRCTWMAKI